MQKSLHAHNTEMSEVLLHQLLQTKKILFILKQKLLCRILSMVIMYLNIICLILDILLPYLIMHQSFVNTPPPTGKGGDCDLSVFIALLQTPPRGQNEIETMLFAPPFTLENLSGVSVLISKSHYIPCTDALIKSFLEMT